MKRLGKLREILSQLIQLEKNSETAKDGRVIYWEGELAEGVALYVLDEEGNEVACPDGEVIIEDKKIVVADGKVSTIETVAAEEPQPTDEPMEPTDEPTDMKTDKANKFSAVVDFYSMSYDERWQLLYKAAEELYPDEFLYIEDAGDDYAIVCLYGDDDTKLYKYSVTWDNDVPTLSNPVEVKRGYIPVNEETEPATEPTTETPAEPINEPAPITDEQMAEQTAELEALRTEVEELRAKLAQPAKMSEQKRLEEMESNENPTDKYAAIAAALRKR